MTRTASCACGRLRIKVEGEPALVAACSCTQCQKRTGTPIQISSYFKTEQVLGIEGADKAFVRASDAGRRVESHFCPECGSTVFWYLEMRPGTTAIGVGSFADPMFPQPTISVWEETGHPWVALPPDVRHFPRSRS